MNAFGKELGVPPILDVHWESWDGTIRPSGAVAWRSVCFENNTRPSLSLRNKTISWNSRSMSWYISAQLFWTSSIPLSCLHDVYCIAASQQWCRFFWNHDTFLVLWSYCSLFLFFFQYLTMKCFWICFVGSFILSSVLYVPSGNIVHAIPFSCDGQLSWLCTHVHFS